MVKLLYIGKSNKRFTYNKTYGCMSLHNYVSYFHASVYYNNSQMMTFKDKDYFDENFKILSEHEQKQLIRKLKLKKINKHEGLF